MRGKSGYEEHEHCCKQGVNALLCAFELFPDKDAPDCCDERCSLAEGVADGRAGLFSGHIVECGTEAPDCASEHSDKLSLGAALEVLSVSHRLSDERVLHHDGVEEEVGDEYADCANTN